VPTELPPDVAVEPIFLIEATYAPDAAETRGPFRAEHIGRVIALRDEGTVIEVGAFADVSASVLLVRAPDEDGALAIARDDVYLRNGIWIEVRARPFGRIVRSSELSSG
jgi:uncharacterized protein YciI